MKRVYYVRTAAGERSDDNDLTSYQLPRALLTPADAADIVRLITWQLCYRCSTPDCASKTPSHLFAPSSYLIVSLRYCCLAPDCFGKTLPRT